jgi:uncharacterized protein
MVVFGIKNKKLEIIMDCRVGCAACCIYVSISSPIPGMENGKPAGVKCINLNEQHLCILHGTSSYPKVCNNLKPSYEMCGSHTEHAITYLSELEKATQPNGEGRGI